MKFRPDQSNFVAHFTSDRAPVGYRTPGNPTLPHKGKPALERLISILTSKTIIAGSLPWKAGNAACFTECPWASLVGHAKHYSPYGVAFAKPRIFAAGGGPVYYVRADHWQKQNWDGHVKTFVTPFWPEYRPHSLKGEGSPLNGKTVDYSHEREWRVPHDFTFDHDQIEFVVLKSYEDMAKFPKDLKDAIGRDKFLLMDVYQTIERLWPIHNH